MRKMVSYLVYLFLTIFLVLPSTSLAKEKVAVVDLKAKHGVNESLAEGLSVVIRDTIHSFGDYEVLSKDDVKVIAERTAIRQSLGSDDTQSLINIGKSLGTKYMVAGAISKFGDTYNLSLRLIETMGNNPGVKQRVYRNCKCAEDELINTSITVATTLMGETESRTASSIVNPYVESDRLKKDKEEQNLDYAPESTTKSKVRLRRRPRKGFAKSDAVRMLLKYSFFDSRWNKEGSFANHFVDNEDYTVTDVATGLMWQRGGSYNDYKVLDINAMKGYIEELNRKQFAGYSDWRLPTTEEMASLLHPRHQQNDLYIAQLFSNIIRSGTADLYTETRSKKYPTCWYVDFGNGRLEYDAYAMMGGTTKVNVRAVRSLE
jgi:TolB-like protein